ncbi:MAG: hypothetical protein CBC24_08275 [Candidatus Pelagibacter sp. TMED64]|jgi:hypothetical protein|nr:MAG: hypothetical protein CBC24_08275 [Candidatus Pelagibacter sp. TMED64]|tara:strand:+ start:83 stop:325 length:243 start_codon:yes stop_codon:yes gene_type:complete
MLKKFLLDCGEQIHFESETPAGVVEKLGELRGAFSHYDNNFLRSKAEVFAMWSGQPIRFDNPDVFAEDLMSAGMLKEVQK